MAVLDADRLAALTAYCRIDELGPGDYELLHSLYSVAVAYMSAAGVSIPDDPDRRAAYDLCVNYLVSDAWDRRSRELSGATAENRAFRALLNQLKLTEPVPESGAGG